MRPDDELLDDITRDGSVDIDGWPELLKRVLSRLEHIAKNSFPQPSLPAPPPPTQDINIVDAAPSQSQSVSATQFTEPSQISDTQPSQVDAPAFSQDGDSENVSPRPMPPPPVIPAFPSPPPLPSRPAPPPDTLHPDDLSLLTFLTQTLTTQFDESPPHTIQRLAELLRNPTTHYRSLPKYLRAVQRVLSVSSTTSAFPLPQNPTETLSNGNGASAFSLGSDESLGGALLTPIPWLTPTSLTEELVGDSHDDGNVDSDITGSDHQHHINGVSQGELLRQEQELNIVPASQVSSPPHRTSSAGAGGNMEEGGQVHAQGPPALGPADVGPQPQGTVFPDPPRSPEEIGSLPTTSAAASIDSVTESSAKDEGMADADADTDAEEERKGEMDVDDKEEQPKGETTAAIDPSGDDNMQVDKVEEEKKGGDTDKKE